ncbi:ribosome biogenesis regulatory protein (RRS1) family protein [Galdieria sulphuraria]|uniref:Ribosome biogenesis regulatory protein n=1 Tax=Galdieria sulphuraria TaxID=130081 RepID=M2WTM6_GALSU|nr:ribosome biogenesis regulatory protein (RRS1) family protein [Galdieria sulphuraria]EME27260.1 ribosome biogenesis regulatory protein (RRS1) family protein [Galdieria sulphuraria]|eukprot:XP_005703780.1 ribosome biogenesis regulatory protein (RRS1) family protein [Galdieria sulphuraria]
MDGVEVDLGSLSCADVRPIFQEETKQELEERIRRSVEFLVHGLFTLPEQSSERKSQRELPEPFSVIPRAKPIPKEKPLTKWEQFAKIRGIRKRKRDKFAWDEGRAEFRPIHGYRSINDGSNQVILPHDPSLEPGESPFDLLKEGKRKRIASNRKNQERNKRSLSKNQLPTHALRADKRSSKSLERSAKIVSISNRSLGKHEEGKKSKQKLSSTKRSLKKSIIPNGVERERTFQAVNDVLKNF